MDETEKRIQAATLYAKLAESARDRFKSRRDLEWRVTIGLWTLFGGGAGVAITARTWVPGLWEIVFAGICSTIVVAVYVITWIPWINKSHRKDSATSYYWESGVVLMLSHFIDEHKELPPHLHPPKNNDDLWPRMSDASPGNVGGAANGVPREITGTLHRAQWLQILVTVAFAVLFVAGLASKYVYHSKQQSQGAQSNRIVIEGEVEIDSTSKIKVGK